MGRSLAQAVSRKRRISLEHMTLGFVVDKVALGQVPAEYVGFNP